MVIIISNSRDNI